MEYLFVSFSEDRAVIVDGEPLGKTNNTLLINSGHHVITLEDPQNYSPATQECVIQNTTPLSPHSVKFVRTRDLVQE